MAALGLHPDQVLGSLVSEFGLSDDPDMSVIVDAHRRALQGEPLTYETQWRDRTFQSHVEPLHDAGGLIVGCIGVALDITERVRLTSC
jgi:PAS domain-containing protein